MAMTEKKRKTIGIFSGYYLPHLGGVERYVDKLSLALMRRGYRVVIVTSNHDDLPSREIVEGRTVYRLPIHKLAKSRYPIPKKNAEYTQLMKDIEQEGIDVFLLNTRFHLTSIVGAEMGKRLQKPVLLIDHGTGHFTVNNLVLDFFGRLYEHALTWWMKRRITHFYGVSKACGVWLQHFSIKAKGVFYNAIQPSDRNAVKDLYAKTYSKDTIVIAYAGRLIKEKGILNLLDAFKQAQQPQQKLQLVIAGDGPLLETIKHDYADPSITLLGKLDFAHMMALYKRTDIFVYPSLYPEGLPTSILEAGLMECAVVATPRGGTAEVITNNQHGIITDGSVVELAEAITRLTNEPKTRRDFSKALRRRVEEHFTWDVVATTVDTEINNLR